MRMSVVHSNHVPFAEEAAGLVLPVFSDALELPKAVLHPDDAGLIESLIADRVIAGKQEECRSVPTPLRAYKSILIVGLGPRDAYSDEVLRRAAGAVCGPLRDHRLTAVVLDASGQPALSVDAFLEGLILGQYRFDRYKARKQDEHPPSLVERFTAVVGDTVATSEVEERCIRADVTCRCTNWARRLANAAPNDLTPALLADEAREMSEEVGCSFECLDEDRLADLGMRALLGVTRGSAEPAKLIILTRRHADDAETVALVGKGITFDAGGVSIKPSESMHEMKYDMCGAAAALGAMMALCLLNPPVNLVCLVPAAENVVDASSQKPGDVVRAYNGKTIEIHNTDAEGRLILADTLAYAIDRFKPDRVVDVATLTGACIVSLGHHAAGLMANDDALAGALTRAGEKTGERVWRLPLWDDYAKLIEGTHADLCNIGPAKEAGAIIGGCFLKEFVGDTPWAHLDIAGTAWSVKNVPYLNPKDATGYGVRLLTEWIRGRSHDGS